MTTALMISCFLIWLMLVRANSAKIETFDLAALKKSQELIRGGDAGGVYIPKETGNKNPNLHYGIVIDCGSSGSRLYIYVWPDHSGKANELLQIKQLLDVDGKPVVKKLEPGLSSMASTPVNATEYLKSLLDFAAQTIPSEKHRDTPLYILATAGLRLLNNEQQAKILEDLFTDIVRDYQFQIEKTHIQVIPGKLEGIYSWIAINYVLGRFQPNKNETVSKTDGHSVTIAPKRQPTVGILDMGGASAQIAYEVSDAVPIEGEEIAEFSLGYDDHQDFLKYKIYVTTFLGYGANKAFEKYIDRILQNGLNKAPADSSPVHVTDADCLPSGYSANYTRQNRSITITGEGDFYNCSRNLVDLLNLNATCKRKPCSLNGVYQPPINYESDDFYGFSEFWYTMEDILRMGGPYAGSTFLNASTNFCNSKWTEIRRWYADKLFPRADLNRLFLQCFKSAWLYAFLHDGLKFPMNYQRLRSASLVNNNDVQWTLGAILYKTRFLPLRTLNQVKSAMHYRRAHTEATTIIALVSLVIILCGLIFYRQLSRLSFRSFFHRNGLHSSTSQSNFNHRYQLLTSVVVDDKPASSNLFSNGPSSSSSYGGRWRNI